MKIKTVSENAINFHERNSMLQFKEIIALTISIILPQVSSQNLSNRVNFLEVFITLSNMVAKFLW